MSDEIPVKNKGKAGEGKPRATTFKKGVSANPAGRPRGSKNKGTLEAKAFCASIVEDSGYQDSVRLRAMQGSLAPAVETMLWYYAKGKPTETVQVNVSPQRLAALPPEELTRLREQAIEATAIIARLTTE